MKKHIRIVKTIDNQCDIPPFFLANLLKKMGFYVSVEISEKETIIWSNCDDKIIKVLSETIHNHISYDDIDDSKEYKIFRKGGK